ncbi:MAG: hypothetical protein B5M56_02660 [Desulfococcus sp. 4484_241]|nr:MAG: hypothetical protein B5M56_02660 [Desulfococcus sp. 4484_241]
MNKRGFTLMEMLIVIAIIGIIAGAVTPTFLRWRTNQQLSQAARQIYSDLQSARMVAIKRNSFAFVSFNTASGTYFGWVDQSGGFSGVYDAGVDDLLFNGSMPPGVRLTGANFSVGSVASFSPMGFGRWPGGALNMGTVTVANSFRTSRIVVNSSGNVRIS